MTSQHGKQTIAIHILSYILRSKGNKTIKFISLIECNIRNIALKTPYTKCGGETIPRTFSVNSKQSIFLNQQGKVLCSLFLLYTKLQAIEKY